MSLNSKQNVMRIFSLVCEAEKATLWQFVTEQCFRGQLWGSKSLSISTSKSQPYVHCIQHKMLCKLVEFYLFWWNGWRNILKSQLLSITVIVVVVVVRPHLVCLSKPTPLRKGKQLAGEYHRSSGLLMLCCALMCMRSGQWVIMGVSATVCAVFIDGIVY